MPKRSVTIELARQFIPTKVLDTLTEQQIQDIIDLMYIHAEFILNHITNKKTGKNLINKESSEQERRIAL